MLKKITINKRIWGLLLSAFLAVIILGATNYYSLYRTGILYRDAARAADILQEIQGLRANQENFLRKITPEDAAAVGKTLDRLEKLLKDRNSNDKLSRLSDLLNAYRGFFDKVASLTLNIKEELNRQETFSKQVTEEIRKNIIHVVEAAKALDFMAGKEADVNQETLMSLAYMFLEQTERLQINIIRLFLFGNFESYSEEKNKIITLSETSKKSLNIILPAIKDSELAKAGTAMGEQSDRLKQTAETLESDWQQRGIMQKTLESKRNELIETVRAFSAENEVRLLTAQHQVKMISLITAGCAVAVLLLFGWLIIRSITRPLIRCVYVANQLAQGDLMQSITADRDDEIGQLLESMKNMLEKLRTIVTDVKNGAVYMKKMTENIKTAADQLSQVSHEMSLSSDEMSQGASEQAAATEEVSSSMQEMAAAIRQNSDNALQTEKIAIKSAEDALSSGKAVEQTVSAMKKIAEKISVIQELARQTNLLALNAAIEAARAGESGRGFAVVASEVRKLAERSHKAAADIGELSNVSVEIAEKTGAMLTGLVPNIQKTSDLVQEISAASNEQNSGAEQINNAIRQLDQVTQQNVSNSGAVASTAQEMATMSRSMLIHSKKMTDHASHLQRTMEFFTVDSNDRNKTGDNEHDSRTDDMDYDEMTPEKVMPDKSSEKIKNRRIPRNKNLRERESHTGLHAQPEALYETEEYDDIDAEFERY